MWGILLASLQSDETLAVSFLYTRALTLRGNSWFGSAFKHEKPTPLTEHSSLEACRVNEIEPIYTAHANIEVRMEAIGEGEAVATV